MSFAYQFFLSLHLAVHLFLLDQSAFCSKAYQPYGHCLYVHGFIESTWQVNLSFRYDSSSSNQHHAML